MIELVTDGAFFAICGTLSQFMLCAFSIRAFYLVVSLGFSFLLLLLSGIY